MDTEGGIGRKWRAKCAYPPFCSDSYLLLADEIAWPVTYKLIVAFAASLYSSLSSGAMRQLLDRRSEVMDLAHRE